MHRLHYASPLHRIPLQHNQRHRFLRAYLPARLLSVELCRGWTESLSALQRFLLLLHWQPDPLLTVFCRLLSLPIHLYQRLSKWHFLKQHYGSGNVSDLRAVLRGSNNQYVLSQCAE